MKNLKKILLCSLILAGLQFGGLSGCVGYVGGGGGGYYDGGVWVQDDVIVGGGRGWYGGGRGYVHPGGWRR